MTASEMPVERPPEIPWDGQDYPYRAAPDLRLGDFVETHTDAEESVDPLGFAIIANALWNVNEEHSLTIATVSPSPIAAIVHDLNCTILSEEGEYIYFAPYIQHLNAASDSAVKWTCEHLAAQVGIEEGDVFLTNDPWVGSNHQQDVCVFAPVMVDGRVFAWVSNSLHQMDLGGSTPGSFCPDARDVFNEAVPIPPFKIVEGGKLKRDLERMYVRRSRMPQMVALDLRSQIAGVNVARERLSLLLGRHGPAAVKGVMRKILDDGEKAFLDKLGKIPNGTWRDRFHIESPFVGDRSSRVIELTVEKDDDGLVVSNRGTDEQVGTLNTSFVGWKGGIVASLIPLFAYDRHFAIGGALRHVRYEPVPGTITCGTWPAAMSCGPGLAVHGTMTQGTRILNRMLLTSPELRENVLCWGSVSQWPLDAQEGIDQRGDYFANVLLEPMIGGTGARWHADGVDSGGHTWDPKAGGANIEENEQFFPILYIERAELADSGAAGYRRGGNTVVSRVVTHGTDRILHSIASSAHEMPAGAGIAGAYPSCPNGFTLIAGTDVQATLESGRIPAWDEFVDGDVQRLPSKARDVEQTRADLYEMVVTGGTALGDPLERDPELVARDVGIGAVSRGAAELAYGVVVRDGEARVDEDATERLRADRRARRLELPTWDADLTAGDDAIDAADHLHDVLLHLAVAAVDGERLFYCTSCRHPVAALGENYKCATRYDEVPLAETNPHFPAPGTFTDDLLILRRYFCRHCAVLLDTDVCRSDTPPFHDFVAESARR